MEHTELKEPSEQWGKQITSIHRCEIPGFEHHRPHDNAAAAKADAMQD
jgi:hypothetical protein